MGAWGGLKCCFCMDARLGRLLFSLDLMHSLCQSFPRIGEEHKGWEALAHSWIHCCIQTVLFILLLILLYAPISFPLTLSLSR